MSAQRNSLQGRNASVATLNIKQMPENDPLKKAFQSIFQLLPASARGHVVASLGELIGTIMFLFMGFAGVQVALITSNKTSTGKVDSSHNGATPSALLYIALAVGFSLAVNAWIFFRISGALFNPIVSMGMVLIGALTPARAALLIVMQTLAAIIAAYMVHAIFPGKLNVNVALHPTVSIAQGVIIEMLLTALIVFTIFMLAAEHHEANFLAPVGIGLAGFLVHLIGVFWTGACLNPARALGPAIVTRTFPHYFWIYWIGPIAGGILAVIFYKLIKALEYETIHAKPVEEQGLPTSTRDADVRGRADLSSLQIGEASKGPQPPAGRKVVPPPPEENIAGMPVALHD